MKEYCECGHRKELHGNDSIIGNPILNYCMGDGTNHLEFDNGEVTLDHPRCKCMHGPFEEVEKKEWGTSRR